MTAAPQTRPGTAAAGGMARRRSSSLPRWAPYAAAAAAGVLVYLVWSRRKANAGTATTLTPAAAATTGVDTSSYNPSDLGSTIPVMSGATSTEATPAPYAPPKGEKQSGSGYTAAPGSAYTVDKAGRQYQAIPNPAAAAGLIRAGQKLFYQVLPGVFVPATGPMLPGTTLFYQVPQ